MTDALLEDAPGLDLEAGAGAEIAVDDLERAPDGDRRAVALASVERGAMTNDRAHRAPGARRAVDDDAR